MAALCLKRLLDQAIRNDVSYITRHFSIFLAQPVKRTAVLQTWVERAHAKKGLLSVPAQVCFTSEGAEEKLKGKKINPNARKTVGSVGRKIPYRIIQLIDENGENQGTMHRADVIRLMDEREVKLVLLNETADPPVYRFMSGQQIHEERLKLREKQKASSKNGPVQQKELTFSAAIGQQDLETKIKHIQEWIDKKHHVRIILHQKNIADGPEKMLVFFDRILETMPEKATYLSQPRVVKGGRSTCVLRHMSDKEMHKYKKEKKEKVQDDSGKETESDVLKQ
ncbi:translation initiation factor IF-3, mitochondrial isoform X2 [Hemicordylus capensis]|nr:translation initiation factor IF-3, mitochondrial isoform X2 [Hemicordylus capensis]XP_053165322.1 translation initiation factor IF-3, mitochondrial isoform X2 [Hemicordylus capensis]XP_053165323.1 translation initiation factor IF-3, mitochondrial isoform X2 [Hemicordylus capensis]